MKQSVTVTDAQRNFADYINRVAYRGERFVLLRGGRPVAELSPVPSGRRLGELPELLAGLPRLGADGAAAWGRELDEARGDLQPPMDPWES